MEGARGGQYPNNYISFQAVIIYAKTDKAMQQSFQGINFDFGPYFDWEMDVVISASFNGDHDFAGWKKAMDKKKYFSNFLIG